MNDALKIFELYLEGAIKQEQPQMHVDRYGNKRWNLPDKMHLKKGHIHNKWLHREDGPAIEWANGDKSWWWQGERHREDGPAIEWADGFKAWFLHDIEYDSVEQWAEALLKQRNEPHDAAAVDAFLKTLLRKDIEMAL